MSPYFFDINDGANLIDDEGTDLGSLEEAKKEAAILAAGLLRDNPHKFWKGKEWTIRVRNERSLTLFEIVFFANLAPTMSGAMVND